MSALLNKLRGLADRNYWKAVDAAIDGATMDELREAVRQAEKDWNESGTHEIQVAGDSDLVRLEDMGKKELKGELLELLLGED